MLCLAIHQEKVEIAFELVRAGADALAPFNNEIALTMATRRYGMNGVVNDGPSAVERFTRKGGQKPGIQ